MRSDVPRIVEPPHDIVVAHERQPPLKRIAFDWVWLPPKSRCSSP